MSRAHARDPVIARLGELVVERDPRRPTGRLLREDGMDCSYVDLADPTHLEFDYLRWLRLILRTAHARRVVHVGGAACALARALAAESPDGRQDVCEVDGAVLELARGYMGLRRVAGMRVHHSDGRAWLASRPDASADAVVLDAFLGARIPERLVSEAALRDVARVAPLALINVVDDRARREVNAISRALESAFGHVWSLGARAGNTIVAGAARPLALERIAAAAAADPSPARLVVRPPSAG